MKAKFVVNIFTGLGALMSVASLIWWGVVYYFVSKQNGESMWGSLDCVYSIGTDCNFLRAMAWLRGIYPYEPLLFWMGAMTLLMCVILRLSFADDDKVELK